MKKIEKSWEMCSTLFHILIQMKIYVFNRILVNSYILFLKKTKISIYNKYYKISFEHFTVWHDCDSVFSMCYSYIRLNKMLEANAVSSELKPQGGNLFSYIFFFTFLSYVFPSSAVDFFLNVWEFFLWLWVLLFVVLRLWFVLFFNVFPIPPMTFTHTHMHLWRPFPLTCKEEPMLFCSCDV